MATKFARELKEGMSGPDVEAMGRALCRAKCFINIRVFNRMPKEWRQNFGPRKAEALLKFKAKKALKNKKKPVYDEVTHNRLLRYYDGKAHDLYRQYKAPPPPPINPPVEPKQGWNSLVKYLWDEYSLGRNAGMYDLGTYNPASRLPSGRKSDHAYYPAKAFDLGFHPYPNKVAYAYFKDMAGEPEVEYVIYGNLIWSRSRGLHTYTSGGHTNHVHLSGRY